MRSGKMLPRCRQQLVGGAEPEGPDGLIWPRARILDVCRAVVSTWPLSMSQRKMARPAGGDVGGGRTLSRARTRFITTYKEERRCPRDGKRWPSQMTGEPRNSIARIGG